MEEKIVWKLVYWDMKMLRDGWFSKPVYRLQLKYGTYRQNTAETKWENKKFKTLEDAFDFLKQAIEKAEKVKL
jgi:hypothetical protein